jgi:uncharacterized protein YlxW (UPF0749 family)
MGIETLIVAVMSTLLGGGLLTALTTLYRARRTVTVERDSIIVTGAHGAVLALEKSLHAESARADREAADNVRLRTEIFSLEAKMDAMQDTIAGLQNALDEMRSHLSTVASADL